MTPTLLSNATGCTLLRAAQFSEPIRKAFIKWGIDTPLRQAYFLGQVAHESGLFSITEENLSYTAPRMMAVFPSRFPTLESAIPFARNPQAFGNKVYGGRMGNVAPGDGFKYRGRGLIQLTGRENYKMYGIAAGFNAVDDPDAIKEPLRSVDAAGWFWHSRGCNAYADKRDINALTRRINGGVNGLADRVRLTERAKTALNVG